MLIFTLLSSTKWMIGAPEPIPDDVVYLDFDTDSGETVMRLYVLQGCDEQSITSFFTVIRDTFGDMFEFKALQ